MRVIVVGGGVVGLACAYELLQDGHEVSVLDRAVPGQATSHGNAAKIAYAEAGPVPAPGMVIQGLKWMLRADSPLYVQPSLSPSFIRFMVSMARHCNTASFRRGLSANLRLAEQANEMFDEWQAAGLSFEMHRRGVLLAWENEEGFRSRHAYQRVFDDFGVHARVLDEDSVQEIEPALSDRLRFGLFYSEDRQIEPDSLTGALADALVEQGGTRRDHTEVTGFVTGPGGAVTQLVTSAGTVACDAVVLSAGVWSAALTRQLGVRLPIRPGKGYSVDYTPAPVPLRTSLTLEDAHVAITPLKGMIRVAGTMEFSGLEDSMRTRRVRAIQRAAADGLRDWNIDAPHRPAWAGMRPMTPDGLPIIGPLADGANVWMATGHGMLGLTQAPTTARMVRDMIRGVSTPRGEFQPQRFASRRTKRLVSG